MLVKGAETAVLNQLASGPGDVTLDHVNEYAEVCMQTLIPGCPDEIYCLQDCSLRYKERKKERRKEKNGVTDRQIQTAKKDRQTCGQKYKQTDGQTEQRDRRTDGLVPGGRRNEQTDRRKPWKKEGRKKERQEARKKQRDICKLSRL